MRKDTNPFRLSLWPEYIAAGLLLSGLLLIIVNVIARYFFNSAIIWAEEILIYTMVWGVFLGCLQGVLKGTHLNMDLLVHSLPPLLRKHLNILIYIISGVTCGFVAVVSKEAFLLMIGNNQVSVVAGIPMAIPHGAILLGFTLMSLASFYKAYETWTTPQ